MNHSRGELCLGACALILSTALVTLMLSGQGDTIALAGDSTVPAPNGIGVITLSNGSGPSDRPAESVYVLDNRTEMLLVYSVEATGATRTVALRYAESLPAIFRAGRR